MLETSPHRCDRLGKNERLSGGGGVLLIDRQSEWGSAIEWQVKRSGFLRSQRGLTPSEYFPGVSSPSL